MIAIIELTSWLEMCIHIIAWTLRLKWRGLASFSRRKLAGGAKLLAQEWTRRGSYFYKLWFSSARTLETFEYTDADLNSYQPNSEFADWAASLAIEHHCFNEAVRVSSAVPTNPRQLVEGWDTVYMGWTQNTSMLNQVDTYPRNAFMIHIHWL